MDTDDNKLFIFWAKTTHDKEHWPHAYHPLLCHMIDVAVVTRVIWHEVLSPATHRRIAKAFGFNEDAGTLAAFIAWIAGLHDLGKASPPFTLRADSEETQKLLRLYDGTPFSEKNPHNMGKKKAREAPHGFVTASELPEILQAEMGFSRTLAERLATMIGGHHGVFPRSQQLNELQIEASRGNHHWQSARRQLVRKLAELLRVPPAIPELSVVSLDNATTMILAGLIAVADWIGSNATYFTCAVADYTQPFAINAEEYLVRAEAQAKQALAELGWRQWPEAVETRTFAELFPNIAEPRALQVVAIDLAQRLDSPGIVVVEAPMGEGKTEAAMYLADKWNARLRQRGIYFALPTQATSNQMFGRVRDFLDHCFADGNVLLQLLHGHASLSAEFQLLLDEGRKAHGVSLTSIYDDAEHHHNGCTPQVVAAEWFTHRKRGLLVPFGVGTVDQALLAVLQTKHVFVRLFGLAHKTVIIDEVHAYDAYMSTLLERLLEWLAALGSPVVLLSATLPKQKRNDLLRAYVKGLGVPQTAIAQVQTDSAGEDRYPRISWATASTGGVRHIQTSDQNTRALYVQHVVGRLPQSAGEAFILGQQLREALQEGGCAAVICNTVQRAQEVYSALKPYFPGTADDALPELDLLHARFRFCDRAEREQRTLRRFGKPNGRVGDEAVYRPQRAVLVSTQIIEQSLDLDFDLMVTDLAPIDLILQRAGRLHRHQRQPSERPSALHKPTLWLCNPEGSDSDIPDFGASKFVYDAHILLRSWLVLKDCEHIAIPDEIETLIEAVYDLQRNYPIEIAEPLQNYWRETLGAHEQQRDEEQKEAEDRWIKRPHYGGQFWRIAADVREEDTPEFHRAHQALTRLTEPSVPLVCLFGTKERTYLDEQRIKPVDLNTEPQRFLVKELLQRSLTVSSKYIALALLQTAVPKGWQESALLRNHRLLVFDENRIAHLANLHFHLDPDVGLRMMHTQGELTYA